MNNKHSYHLVNPSPWPILLSVALLTLTIGAASFFHSYKSGLFLITLSFSFIAILASFWWRDVIREGTYLRNHTKRVLSGLRLGFILFIVSEVMFFFSFFWAYFHSSLSPNIEIGSQWPPFSLEIIGLVLPTVNTIILLTSGATITVAHLAILREKKALAIESLIVTLILALIFTMTPNAIHALLALILLFINFSFLLFLTESIFLGFAYILVYIGAICVLFLYIILLLHLRSYSLMQRYNSLILLGLIALYIPITSFLFLETTSDTSSFSTYLLNDQELFASYLFKTHQHYMFLSVFLLLLALFLSIFLSTKIIRKSNTITYE